MDEKSLEERAIVWLCLAAIAVAVFVSGRWFW